MLYTDLIDGTPVTMTARQLKLAVQEAVLVGREQALNEAADMLQGRDVDISFAYQQMRMNAEHVTQDREELKRDILATFGFVS